MITDSLPFAYGGPLFTARLRARPDHFIVDEDLGFECSGEGEHLFIRIQKTDLNTNQVAEQLARYAGISTRQVNFSGMKDRHAVTSQWFGLHMPGQQGPDWSGFNTEQIKVLDVARHSRKLRRGVHRGNRFTITLSQLDGNLNRLEQKLQQIATGVPNYFGEQRFGIDGRNLDQARRWFQGAFTPRRQQRSIYLSAARSWIFNKIAAERVTASNWRTILPGDIVMLAGSQSVFLADDLDSLNQRASAGDVWPTAAMAGQPSKMTPEAEVAALEQAVFEGESELLTGLERQGLKAQRRALAMVPEGFEWELTDNGELVLQFFLPRGCFATALVRELARYSVVQGTAG